MKAQRSSIQRKLMRLIMLVCGTVLFVSCASFVVYEFFTYRNISRQELTTLGEVTAINLSPSLVFLNEDDATELLYALKAQKHIVAAIAYDKDQQLFASYPDTLPKEHLPAKLERQGYHFTDSYIAGFEPVMRNGKQVGLLYLKSDMKGAYRRLLFYALVATGFFLFVLLFTWVLSKRLQRSITQPVLHLSDMAKRISDEKDFSVRAEKTTSDELGTLTDAFNQMLAQIEAQNREIQALNANLEEKIAVRTWELQQANGALVEQNEFIQTIIDASVDVIAVIDKDLNFLILNKAASTFMRREPVEVIGKNLLDVFPNLAGQSLVQSLKRALEGELIHMEAYHSMIGDAWFENFFIPLHDKEDDVDRVLLIAHDITGIMKANEKLQKLNMELEKSNRDLEQFAYVASHDLQEPLRKITTFADLSERNAGSPEIQKRYLQKISSSARRMTELIKAVLNYSRLSTSLEFTTVDLNAVIAQLQTDLELVIDEKKALISTDPLPVVKGIPLQLSQLFQNLLTNSLKFSESAPAIEIRVLPFTPADKEAVHHLHHNGEFLKIGFSDNGIGFEQEYADRVFAIFQRLHNADHYAGTGIGLALCKKIAENHGGTITVKSEKGKGTTFFIYLPFEQLPAEQNSLLTTEPTKQLTNA
jgi:PAS domain S-box-containing protein